MSDAITIGSDTYILMSEYSRVCDENIRLEAERDEWKGKFEWCCQKLRQVADKQSGEGDLSDL